MHLHTPWHCRYKCKTGIIREIHKERHGWVHDSSTLSIEKEACLGRTQQGAPKPASGITIWSCKSFKTAVVGPNWEVSREGFSNHRTIFSSVPRVALGVSSNESFHNSDFRLRATYANAWESSCSWIRQQATAWNNCKRSFLLSPSYLKYEVHTHCLFSGIIFQPVIFGLTFSQEICGSVKIPRSQSSSIGLPS